MATNDTQNNEALTWTVEQTAALLGLSLPSAYEGVRTGAIPSIKVGRRLLVPKAALARLLEGAAA